MINNSGMLNDILAFGNTSFVVYHQVGVLTSKICSRNPNQSLGVVNWIEINKIFEREYKKCWVPLGRTRI